MVYPPIDSIYEIGYVCKCGGFLMFMYCCLNVCINLYLSAVCTVPAATLAVKRGSGRSRGRPRGSGVSLRSRGPASIQRSLVAAEEAAATAAKTAAYAAYGYSYTSE